MRGKSGILVACALVLCAGTALAELQNIEVGGSVRIRGNYINNEFTDFTGPPEVRIRGNQIPGRAMGGMVTPAGDVLSIFDWDNKGPDLTMIEQRTRLHVKADFTENVTAFIELDSYDYWGEDFRSSNYLTGADSRSTIQNGPQGQSFAEVEVFQAYVEAREIFGTPLRLRVGRQELAFGSQWLVGPRDFAFLYTGLSFDAVRLSFLHEWVEIDLFASRIAEGFDDFLEEDIDFYGLYASLVGVEGFTFDAYYFLLRDDQSIRDTSGSPSAAYFNVDTYDTTLLHTVGLRAAGATHGFDFDVEGAYQFGTADAVGATFRVPYPALGIAGRGDNHARFDNWAFRADLGYTFDVVTHPRIFFSGRYYGGEDRRDTQNLDPWHRPQASVSFNRLFSNQIASGFVDVNNDLSNAWLVTGGVQALFFERLGARFFVTYYEALGDFDAPMALSPGQVVEYNNPNDDDIGVDIGLFLEYYYSQDLVFEAGWTHMFSGDALKEGQFTAWNGTQFAGGQDGDDADYVYLGTKIKF